MLRTAALLGGLLAPLLAFAQASPQGAAPPMPEDPRAPRYREVERGGFVGFESGALMFFDTKAADPSKVPTSARDGGGKALLFLVGANAGYDVTDHIALSLFALGASGSASSAYGSFNLVAGGADLRVAFLGARDGQGVDRIYAYLHARGGWLVTRPTGLLGDTDLLVTGGPGIEYYTRLRHFSVGLALDAAYLTKAKTAGVAVFPTVRYTF